MAAPRVYVSETAFLQLLVSSVELYSNRDQSDYEEELDDRDGESFGYLFGTRTSQKDPQVYRIDFVVPCQRVLHRDNESVQPSPVAEKRILSVLTPFPCLDLLGTFHSHLYETGEEFKIPDSVSPSPKDHKSWTRWWNDDRKGRIGFELIFGLQELKKRGWKPTEAKVNCIEGRWKRYAYAMGAWYIRKPLPFAKKKKPLLQPVHWLMCPTTFGFTREDLRND